MKKSRSVKQPAIFKKYPARLSRVALAIILGAIAAVSAIALSSSGAGSSNGVAASSNPALASATQKRYKATRPFVVDRQTGQLRMPTKQEIDEVVSNLSTLAKRPSEGLPQTAAANGGVAVDLDGGFGGVMLARPADDGTWETKCVFTLEEGIEFLGIQEDNSQQ